MVRSRRRPPPTPGQSPKTRPFVARTGDHCRQPCAPPHCQWPLLLIQAAERPPLAHTPCSASPTSKTPGRGDNWQRPIRSSSLSPCLCAPMSQSSGHSPTELSLPGTPFRFPSWRLRQHLPSFRLSRSKCTVTCWRQTGFGPLTLSNITISYIRSPLSQHGLLFNAWSLPLPPLSLFLSVSLSLSLSLSLSPSLHFSSAPHPSNPLLRLIHPALLFYLSLVFLLGALDTWGRRDFRSAECI